MPIEPKPLRVMTPEYRQRLGRVTTMIRALRAEGVRVLMCDARRDVPTLTLDHVGADAVFHDRAVVTMRRTSTALECSVTLGGCVLTWKTPLN